MRWWAELSTPVSRWGAGLCHPRHVPSAPATAAAPSVRVWSSPGQQRPSPGLRAALSRGRAGSPWELPRCSWALPGVCQEYGPRHSYCWTPSSKTGSCLCTVTVLTVVHLHSKVVSENFRGTKRFHFLYRKVTAWSNHGSTGDRALQSHLSFPNPVLAQLNSCSINHS